MKVPQKTKNRTTKTGFDTEETQTGHSPWW
jgi:hypothetical protein